MGIEILLRSQQNSCFGNFHEALLTNIKQPMLFSAVLFEHENTILLFICDFDNTRIEIGTGMIRGRDKLYFIVM